MSAVAQQDTQGCDAEGAALEQARALLQSTPLIDGHNDLPWAIRQSKTKPRDVRSGPATAP